LPELASEKLPSRGQVAVQATINGHRFQTVLEPDGYLGHWMRIEEEQQQRAPVTGSRSNNLGSPARATTREAADALTPVRVASSTGPDRSAFRIAMSCSTISTLVAIDDGRGREDRSCNAAAPGARNPVTHR